MIELKIRDKKLISQIKKRADKISSLFYLALFIYHFFNWTKAKAM